MRVAVIGSRGFTNYNLLSDVLTKFSNEQKLTTIISGGAQGADKLAEVYAKTNNIPIIIYPADWAKHGRAAGPIRNKQLVNDADYIIAFWDGKSPGTLSSINFAKGLNKPVNIITI